jgi:type IV pilus assembly protein PilB
VRKTPVLAQQPAFTLSPKLTFALSAGLMSEGWMTKQQLDAAGAHALRVSVPLVDAIVDLGFAPETVVYTTLAAAAGMNLVDPRTETVSPLALRIVPEKVARRHTVVPLAVDDRTITYVTSQPLDGDAERDIEFTSGRRAVAVLACRTDVESLLDRAYPRQSDVERLLARLGPHARSVEEIDSVQSDAPTDSIIIDLCNQLIARAVETGASDVHIECTDEEAIVRYRVSGIMEPVMTIPSTAVMAVRNRFKIMANADIAVRHRPQDGAFALRVNGRRIDVRLSTLPTVTGEKIVMRVIDSRSELQSLDALGYDEALVVRLRRSLARPDGLVLVTGPTGSGKTTALYAALNELRTGRVNIVSVEDPVERAVAGVSQIPVNNRAGSTFATILRSVLRQDPNVLMVGEIRDAEVAGIVGQAAYTGHLILSSLHTGDAASAVSRLLNLGLEPYKIAESLTAILAQRLVRRLCPECRIVHNDLDARKRGKAHDIERVAASAGAGCVACRFTGYTDRVPVVELLTPTEEIRAAILRGASAAELRAAMRAGGMPNMRQAGLQLVASGVTSLDELDRVLAADEPAAAEVKPAVDVKRDGRQVLIADDEPITRMLVKILLERDGYSVLEAQTGREALEIAARQRPDLIVMDLNMPQMDGYDAIRQLRLMPALSDVPVVVLTSDDGPGVERRVLEIGANDYLVKPFDPAVLSIRIQSVFRRKRLAA